MSFLLKGYKAILFRYPKSTQAIQTGILMSAGNVISQTLVEKQSLKNLDFARTFQFFSLGVLFIGPACTIWYRTLNTYLGSSGKSVALKKVVIDQLCFAPPCIFIFLSAVGTLQGKTIDETKEDIKKNYLDVLIANYKLWPMVQMANFYFVPLHFQVLLVQGVALIWNTFLSFKTRPNQ